MQSILTTKTPNAGQAESDRSVQLLEQINENIKRLNEEKAV
jgi:hypothetical protein